MISDQITEIFDELKVLKNNSIRTNNNCNTDK